MARANALAVLRLIINSTLVACCTGRSAGFYVASLAEASPAAHLAERRPR
jgi:hypothetical protein